MPCSFVMRVLSGVTQSTPFSKKKKRIPGSLFFCFVGKKDFLLVADVMNVKVIEVKDQVTLLERFIPRIYNSRVSAKIRVIVCHK